MCVNGMDELGGMETKGKLNMICHICCNDIVSKRENKERGKGKNKKMLTINLLNNSWLYSTISDWFMKS